jgi:formin-binding protein 1
MQSRLVQRFSTILAHAQALQLSHLDVLRSRLNAVEASVNAMDPSRDQALFIDYNIRPFSTPPDYQFEPCVNFYDTVSDEFL